MITNYIKYYGIAGKSIKAYNQGPGHLVNPTSSFYKVKPPKPTPIAKPTLYTTCIHLVLPNACMWYIVLVLRSGLGGFTLHPYDIS